MSPTGKLCQAVIFLIALGFTSLILGVTALAQNWAIPAPKTEARLPPRKAWWMDLAGHRSKFSHCQTRIDRSGRRGWRESKVRLLGRGTTGGETGQQGDRGGNRGFIYDAAQSAVVLGATFNVK
jgi:hypothetical protein